MTKKKDLLFLILKRYGSLLVAYSGGVDSSFLLAAAHEVLGRNLLAVTAASPLHPETEIQSAAAFAKELGVEHLIIESKEMNLRDFTANTKERCYVCKKFLLEELLKIAGERKIDHVAHGANVDDLNDYRPGLAAAGEMGIKAPLVDAGMTKNDIRMMSRQMNLKTWNKPPMACLATRIPYGTPITFKALNMAARAEQVLLDLGFTGCRVRVHGDVARIEVDTNDFEKIIDGKVRTVIIEKLRSIGFSHVAMDLEGYRSGSMNRALGRKTGDS